MTDNLTPEVRSYIMSRIRSKDTKPELVVRRFLHRAGFRYRLQRRDLPGRPDLVLSKYNTVVLVHGCFWHAHPDRGCTVFKWPTSRPDWWKAKLKGNRKRDHKAVKSLEKLGWQVVVVWECELRPELLRSTLARIVRKIKRGILERKH